MAAPNFFLLFLLNSLREYFPWIAHTSPVIYPAVWLSTSLSWNKQTPNHQTIHWLPDLMPRPSQLCSISQYWTVFFFTLSLALLLSALLSVSSRSPWLAPLLLTSENRCPQLLLTPYFSCLCNSIYSQGFICYAWGWPSNLHLQAILLTYTPNLYF